MIGMYTEEEMNQKILRSSCLITAKDYLGGNVVIRIGCANNYYRRELDDSWTNYDCKTVDRI